MRATVADAGHGRDVTLVCVTKYASLEHTAALASAGGQHLGENLLPAGALKFAALREQGLNFTAHMLGPLQSRKAVLCAQTCNWYQALERIEIAQKIEDELSRVGRRMDTLIQLHVGGEDRKHGISQIQLESFIEQVAALTHLRIRGLMCIPPGPSCFLSPAVYEAQTRKAFRQMASLFARMRTGYAELPIDTLSMGMSGDYRWAIEEGATMVRIGRALFEGLS
ncbi:MAG: YggS family pyridoxal phosphate-dependent enzyme [bacterium]|nr:YggS family pyridoxal phosphate-dependent enzyme [bacterium]